MRTKWLALSVVVLIFLVFVGRLSGQDMASPEEVIAKVREAAAFLGNSTGEDGLAAFNSPQGKWVWKDTYVFVYNCEKGIIAAHPTSPNLIGKNMMGLKDIKGNRLYADLCKAAKNPDGGWAEYWWPKPGSKEPARKISYMLRVPNSPYQVGAGIYESSVPIQKLREMLN